MRSFDALPEAGVQVAISFLAVLSDDKIMDARTAAKLDRARGEPLETNRRNWNERASIHTRDTTGAYMSDRFLAGADTLFPIESEEIGSVSGKRLLHLQYHIGLDTLSLARRGAQVTGLDFSPIAIAAARDFSRRTGIAGRFVEAEVCDAAQATGESYDVIYTTWGTVVWLPDIRRWAHAIAATLASGGRLYFLDTHPHALTLEEADGRLAATYPWRTPRGKPLVIEGSTTYTGDRTPLISRITYQWLHPLGGIVSSLIEAGLVIERVREHDRLPYKLFPMMVDAGQRMFRLPSSEPATPLSVSIEAHKT
ncbi:MAG: class I SAM-dependent methyltransferase [Bryobacteraceae bacterium]